MLRGVFINGYIDKYPLTITAIITTVPQRNEIDMGFTLKSEMLIGFTLRSQMLIIRNPPILM